MPYDYPRPAGLTAGLNQYGGLLNGRGDVVVVDSRIEPMYLDNWFLGAQRSLPHRIVIEGDYIGSRGGNAYFKWNINRFNGDMFDGVFDGVLPGFAAGQLHGLDRPELVPRRNRGGEGDAHRHQLRRVLHLREGDRLLQHVLATAAAGRLRPCGPGQGTGRFRRAAEGVPLGDLDDSGTIGRHGKALFAGWQASGVMIAQSGTPFTVICEGRPFTPIRDSSGRIVGNSGCDYNADNAGNDRPNVPAFGSSLSGLSNDDFLNGIFTASDFPTPAPGVQGTLGRNTFRGPRYFNVDFSIGRSIRVPAGRRTSEVQLRLETFNLFNTTNLDLPQRNMTSPQFGRSTSALPGRIVQLGGRVIF